MTNKKKAAIKKNIVKKFGKPKKISDLKKPPSNESERVDRYWKVPEF